MADMEKVLRNLVVLEGLDGAGTTTQMCLLASALEGKGRKVAMTAEPTDEPIGRLIRSILRKECSTSPWSLAMLYSADRNDHVISMEKETKKGTIVISDRYFYSSLAYQSVNSPFRDVWDINKGYPHAQYVIYIDTPVEECMRRIEHRGLAKELFEKKAFLGKVRENYEKAFTLLPHGTTLIRIDGRLSLEKVTSEIIRNLPI